MCGIIGVMAHNGQLPMNYQKAIKELLWADTVRGEDSTGILSLVGKKKLMLYKEPIDGYNFTFSEGFRNVIYKHMNNHKFILGHNRAATIGAVTKDSAHPFQFSGLVGVHNGTISSFGRWQNKEADMHQYEVDSQQLYFLINKHGVDEVLKEVYGSYALVFYDRKHKTLNFVRNADRPLWFCKTERNALFWASERDMLEWVLKRNNITNRTFEMLPTHTLWSFKINDTTKKTERQDVGRRPAITYSTGQHYPSGNRWRRHQQQRNLPAVSNAPTPISSRVDPSYGGNIYQTPTPDCRKEYTGRFERTGYHGGQHCIFGHLAEEPYSEFVVKGTNNLDYQRWVGTLLLFKPLYYDKILKRFVVRYEDIEEYCLADDGDYDDYAEVGFVTGPRGVYVSHKEFNELVQHGCIGCGEVLDVDDSEDIFWSDETPSQPICPNCVQEYCAGSERQAPKPHIKPKVH